MALRLFLRSSYRPERMCALTDGVYAIVLTLLVLDLRSPEEPGRLTEDLVKQIPNLGAYSICFFALGYFWLLHHSVFASLKACDMRTLVGNLGHLLLVSLTPFAASLVGRYENQASVIALSVVLGLTSATGSALAHHVTKHEGWLETVPEGRWVDLGFWGRVLAPLVTAGSIALSFVSTEAALLLWLLLPLRFVVVQLRPA